ncbi:hypothetical protein [Enhygromyxa salina]|uniref:hypothetical protein n=1 Tax=Enhygromyxa salina TaxID=215803 RepID=UPI000D0266A6|nr:hypothetical protein [Enhygromyxa salina]
MITKLLVAALLASAPAAHDLQVRWAGAPECQGGQRMIERLEVLAPELSVARAETSALVTATVIIERDPRRQWSVRLELDGPLGVERRTFVAESCAVAIDATALVLAVAIDPVAVAARINEEAHAPEPRPKPEPEPQFEPAPPLPARSEGPDAPAVAVEDEWDPGTLVISDARADRPPEQSGRVRFGIAALAGGGYGPMQAGSATVMGRLAVIGQRWRVELRGAWLPPLRPPLNDRGRARVDGFTVGALGCNLFHAGPVEFPLCAGIEAGAVRARALEPIQNPEMATQPIVEVVLGPGLSWAPTERVALGLEVQALIPFVFGGFALDNQTALDTAPVGIRALAGVEIRLP